MRKKLAAIDIEINVILMEEGCVAKERKEIESVTESGTEFVYRCVCVCVFLIN